MHATSVRLADVIASAYTPLMTIPEEVACAKPYADKWSMKEVIGHLIDSAANNHQRFVRMQELPHIGTFRYSQNHWVESQRYTLEPWVELVEFWSRYNRHLVHVIANVNPATLSNVCDVGNPEPVTLQLIIEDYVRHLEHHLSQILSGVDARERQPWK
jgi:hypothetical protein